MKWVNTSDLKTWLNDENSSSILPQVYKKLIRATTKSINEIRFSYGDNVVYGGWDGILDSNEKNEWVPSGRSLWEFSKNAKIKGNADENYQKRSDEALGFNKSECEFIYVTPRQWPNSQKWIGEKEKDSVWKNIKVFDMQTLDEWLEEVPSVAAWFAIKHLNKFPEKGVESTEVFWEIWSGNKVLPDILLAGRDKEVDQVIRSIQLPGMLSVHGNTNQEALCFIIASFKDKGDVEEDFFSRSLIVDSPEVFKELSIINHPLILIPRFEDASLFAFAVSKGHNVFVALGADASESWENKIKLPPLNRDLFVAALEKMGYSKDKAEKLSKESARNITVLRRQMKLDHYTPEWARPDNIADLIPAILVGKWDENSEGDKKIISDFAGVDYDTYIEKLMRWRHAADSPIIKIGNCWRLTSSLDAWFYSAKYLTKNNFNKLKNNFLDVLREINPAFDLPSDKRYMASVLGKSRSFSGRIREGLTQSLILISTYGKDLKLDMQVKGDVWVDSVITELLTTEDVLVWKSLENKLPHIAEASPGSFLTALENVLLPNSAFVSELFVEEPGMIIPKNYTVSLLWALEAVAWLPEYLGRATLILGKLSSIDKEGKSGNRPIHSLQEIFKPWHFQTFAPFKGRMAALRLICTREKEVGWKLLTDLLPGFTSETATGCHKFRWRLFDMDFKQPITYKEIWDTHTEMVNLLLEIFDGSEEKLADLISHSTSLGTGDQKIVLDFVIANCKNLSQQQYTAWEAAKHVLSHHRSYRNSDHTMSEEELTPYQTIYDLLKPADTIKRNIWMFNTTTPEFAEGIDREHWSHEKYTEAITSRRIEGLTKIYTEFGIEKVNELSGEVAEPWPLGDTLAHLVSDLNEIISVCRQLNGSQKNVWYVQSFIGRKFLTYGLDWVFELYGELQKAGFSNVALAKVFTNLRPSKRLWNFIDNTNEELVMEYWTTSMSIIYWIAENEREDCLKYLFKFKRYFSALEVASLNPELLPSKTIIDVLESAITIPTSEKPTNRIKHSLDELFEEIDKRSDIDEDTLTRIEWLYLQILTSHSAKRRPELLHKKILNDPSFFVDLLKVAYMPQDRSLLTEERKGRTDEEIRERAKACDELMSTCKKIPGVEESKIDAIYLNNWVDEARKLAAAVSRANMCDLCIGKMLARFPENSNVWPPAEIASVIERINTKEIKSGFRSETINKRSFTSRMPFDGGTIERNTASYFHDLANKHQDDFPVIASILSGIAKSYEQHAVWEDERAELDLLDY